MIATFLYFHLAVAGDGVFQMVSESGSFVKVILMILLSFSIVSWAVIIQKQRILRRVEGANSRFLRAFRSGEYIRDSYDRCVSVIHSPLSGMLKEGYRELERFKEKQGSGGNHDLLRQNLSSVLDMKSTEEVSRLRRYLVFLAITSSVCPFFGLLGTVWGVMDAFLAIGVHGSANIAVVAPGIAEALITTVAGLAAAIPAVVAYNYFVSRHRRIVEVVDNFALEFTNAAVYEVI